MRRLLKVSIEGFKTFADQTELDLREGLTAVVGPNGSGKSNLIDAIAWAVGDRSLKSLRGEGMEDLLSRGSGDKPGAGAARVTLEFANEDRLLGLDFAQVSVTRELRRGEPGRVFLNGVETRLREVQAALSGTGLVGGFSLIRQGMMDRVILGSPQDIGRWLEESANLQAYRLRRREAAERLRKAEANAVEARRKLSLLRRELGQVQERAARVRARSALVGRRAELRKLLSAWERASVAEALGRVRAEEARLEATLAALARSRQELALGRACVEEDLGRLGGHRGGEEHAPCAGGIDHGIRELGRVGGGLTAAAKRLAEEREAAWPDVRVRLAQDVRAIEGLLSSESRTLLAAESSAAARHLAELRRLGSEDSRKAEEERREGALLMERRCERARLEERLRSAEPAAAGEPADLEPLDPDRLREEIEAVERDLASIGPVDETAELREKDIVREIEELVPVLEDIDSSRGQLEAFCRKIDAYTEQIFEATRARVEARFANYCAILFGGTEASLARVSLPAGDGDHPPGLDVRVKLPRKPEVSLTLLSGGERSLAGIALILALASGDGGASTGRLLILDEIDAALDEENAGRLSRLLVELQRDHQILCVTHNKQTMRLATELVGVAIGATASSRLLRVRLGDAA